MSTPATRLLARAFTYWERRQEVISHNLANAGTEGFRGQRVFARLMEGQEAPDAVGRVDLSDGAVTRTGNALDVALDGEGFFVVETENGPRYTRAGSFGVDESGLLVDGSGRAVLGETGPLVLPPGTVEITPEGRIEVDGEPLGRLRVERFPPGSEPVREGATLFRAPEDAAAEPDPDTRVRQGHVEESNVDPVTALVEMIQVQRAYGALERSALALDDVMDTISNRLGRVG